MAKEKTKNPSMQVQPGQERHNDVINPRHGSWRNLLFLPSHVNYPQPKICLTYFLLCPPEQIVSGPPIKLNQPQAAAHASLRKEGKKKQTSQTKKNQGKEGKDEKSPMHEYEREKGLNKAARRKKRLFFGALLRARGPGRKNVCVYKDYPSIFIQSLQ